MGALRGGQKYGIIAPRKIDKPHVCKMHITWFRSNGTLYRCLCGKVYCLVSRLGANPKQGYSRIKRGWEITDLEKWDKAGGSRN